MWGPQAPRRTFGEKHWQEPYAWDRKAAKDGVRRRVFVGSMCDWCEDHPTTIEEVKKLWPIIRATPNLDWLLLTKRPELIFATLPLGYEEWPNLWLGTSIENADYTWRADELRGVPARIRFISYEPALGPLSDIDLTGIDWVIYGGESGPGFRQDQGKWAEDIKEKCDSIPIAFWMKQLCGPRPGMFSDYFGQLIQELPYSHLAKRHERK